MNRLISIIIAILLSAAAFAQSVPQTVNFSATVRDANNELLANTAVNVRLTFYEGGEGGTPVYCALHQTVTNANGFMSFQLNRNVLAYACNGAPNTPFEEIPWENGNYWMHVEYQAQIAGDFIDLGYLELTSGFYAFSANYALIAQKLEGFDIDVANAQDGDILVYNGATRKWEARRPENIGGGDTPQPGNYTEGTFQWERIGPQASGLDEYGLYWQSNTKSIYANIKPLDGARLYILNSADYSITDINTLNARLTSETEATVYRGVSVDVSSATYDDVLATVYNGKTYLINVTRAVMTYDASSGSHCTITGTYKLWESGTTVLTSYSEPTGYTNGHGYVDLGLPSGTRWATCNVGASTPTAYGNYYAWGETTTKETYTWTNYRFRTSGDSDYNVRFSKYNTHSSCGPVDDLTALEASDDAATANWGSGWRMPTDNELGELKRNCTVTNTTLNGVSGHLFTGPNGNSIFLPAAGCRYGSELRNAGSYGYYWSSLLKMSIPPAAWDFEFGSYYGVNANSRNCGLSVRAVCVSQN